MDKTWKPIVAGILDILYGVVIIGMIIWRTDWQATLENPLWIVSVGFLIFLAISGVLAILGGSFAISRRTWRLALVGSIAVCFPILSLALGIPAIILTAKSKKEFK